MEKISEKIRTNKADKIAFLVLFLFLLYSLTVTYYRTYVSKDYVISTEIGCDPSIENCLVYTCDLEVDDECPEDEEEWTSYYKIIKKKYANIPREIVDCDPHFSECPELSCAPGEPDCQIIGCNPETVGEEEECITPEEYNLENPEEAEECAEDDEDCVLEESEECLEDEEACVSEDTQTEEDGEAMETEEREAVDEELPEEGSIEEEIKEG